MPGTLRLRLAAPAAPTTAAPAPAAITAPRFEPDDFFDFDEVGFGFGGRVVLVERDGAGFDAGFGAGLGAGFEDLERTSGAAALRDA